MGHFAIECESKHEMCNLCKKSKHLSKPCRSKPTSKQQGQDETVKEPVPKQKRKPKLQRPENKNKVSFAKATKREQAREEEGMVVSEYMPYVPSNEPENELEWLAYFGACRHVCNNLKLLWDVKQLT